MLDCILNVSHQNFISGGSDRVFIETGELLLNNGHQVIPFCSRNDRNADSEFSNYFPQTIDIEHPQVSQIPGFIYSQSARNALNNLLSDYKIDLAHLHIYYGRLTASILKPLRERNIPIVQTLHEYKAVCPVYTLTSDNAPCESCKGHSFWRALPKRCNRKSVSLTAISVIESYVSRWLGAVDEVDHFIGISDFLTRKMIELGIPAERITTVHNFIDCARYQPRYEPGSYVLYFGRLERVKGIYTLLDAAADIGRTRIVIAGTGRESENVRRIIENRGLSNVEMLGFVSPDRLPELIRGALCTVLPSEWYEPFGLAAIESQALGKPVIGTRMGGIPELIADQVDGIHIPPYSADSLRDAIIAFVRCPERAAEMGRAGRNKVEQLFNKERHYASLMDVYRKAAANAAAR